jgi:gliding motility-associated lipoprotein GldH
MTIIKKVKRGKILSPSNLLIGLLLLFAACDDVRLHAFRELHGEWAATDTLEYEYFNNSDGGAHDVSVQLRCSSSYPVRELWLRVECVARDAHQVDTLCCEVFDSLGRQQGTSVGLLYQTSHALGVCNVSPGDTAIIKVTHLMDGSVSGVSDIGVKVCGRGRHLFSGN